MSRADYSKQPGGNKGSGSGLNTPPPALSTALDLRGVKCPLNWARARVHLETLPRGAQLELILDDPKGARDIPRAAEAQGYAIVSIKHRPDDWRIVILV
jgi:TusA-related sulfurtransferase